MPDDVTLRDYVLAVINANDKRYEQRFDAAQQAIQLGFSAQKAAVDAALAAQERAVAKAEAGNEKRFEGVNEFRNALSDQQRMLIPRLEAEAMFRSLEKDLEPLKAYVETARAERQGLRGGWGYAVGVIGIVVAVVTLAIRVFGG